MLEVLFVKRMQCIYTYRALLMFNQLVVLPHGAGI